MKKYAGVNETVKNLYENLPNIVKDIFSISSSPYNTQGPTKLRFLHALVLLASLKLLYSDTLLRAICVLFKMMIVYKILYFRASEKAIFTLKTLFYNKDTIWKWVCFPYLAPFSRWQLSLVFTTTRLCKINEIFS